MKLFACMCNQPQRLAAALDPIRPALVADASADEPISRWGLGYIQGGDVLLVRTPRSSTEPVDLAAPLSEIRTDCAIAQAVSDPRGAYAGTDNTPPFRYRRWLFAQAGVDILIRTASGTLAPAPDVGSALLEHIPEYLRRNIRGRTPGEVTFHLFLSMLHDEGSIDDPNLPTSVTRRALATTLRLVTSELEKLEISASQVVMGNVALTNGRSMVVARLDQPLGLHRLTVSSEDETSPKSGSVNAFRGLLFLSSKSLPGTADGFEEVPANQAVLVSRDLTITYADLEP